MTSFILPCPYDGWAMLKYLNWIENDIQTMVQIGKYQVICFYHSVSICNQYLFTIISTRMCYIFTNVSLFNVDSLNRSHRRQTMLWNPLIIFHVTLAQHIISNLVEAATPTVNRSAVCTKFWFYCIIFFTSYHPISGNDRQQIFKSGFHCLYVTWCPFC